MRGEVEKLIDRHNPGVANRPVVPEKKKERKTRVILLYQTIYTYTFKKTIVIQLYHTIYHCRFKTSRVIPLYHTHSYTFHMTRGIPM